MARIPNVTIRSEPWKILPMKGEDFQGSMNFFIKVDDGRARKVQAFLDEFPGEIYMGSFLGARKFARKLHQLVRRCIRTGIPPKGVSWPPHAASTVKRLGAHKLLNLTGFYLKSIRIVEDLYRDTIAVGLPKGLRRPSNIKGSHSMTMKQIAQILEYGGPKIPARPLWRPAFQQIGGNARLKKDIINGIRKQIRSKLVSDQKYNIKGIGYEKEMQRGYRGNWGDFWSDVSFKSTPSTYIPHSDGPDDFPF